MTENYPYASTPPQRGEQFPPAPAEEQGPADVVKSQATDLSPLCQTCVRHQGRTRSL